MGEALGALLSQSGHIDTQEAVAALAVTGVLIGYSREHGWFNRPSSATYDYRYGGPRGEVYTNRPSAETLRRLLEVKQ